MHTIQAGVDETQYPLKKRILVIDDEHRLAESLAALLRDLGYFVETAVTGPEGLRAIQTKEYDLVITDIRMETVDGFDIMRVLAQLSPQTSVIAITGHASTDTAIRALHEKVADYIPKPFDFEILRRAVERVFAQQEAERLREDMIYMLTHDIKVPLTNIAGFAQLGLEQREAIDHETERCFRIIQSNCNNVIGMMDNFLTNDRLEKKTLEVFPATVNLKDILREELGQIFHLAQKKDQQIQVELQQDAQTIEVDEHLFRRVVSNLLNNAIKYCPDSGEILIRSRRIDNALEVTISNSSQGLSTSDIDVIFKKYRRSGKNSRGIAGSGLGLHIVRSVVEAHGGRITCTLQNQMISFTMLFPQ